MKILNTKLIRESKEENLTEGLIDKIKQIIKGKKSDTQAIQDISDILNVDLSPAKDDKPEKQGQKIRVDEALHGAFDIETFFKMAKDIGITNLGELETFLKNEKQPDDKDEWETMLRYRASLGNDFKIKENLEEEKEDKDLTEDKETCVLCGKHIDGYGNNPAPLADEGKCCDECNSTKVIPARMKVLRDKKRVDEDIENEIPNFWFVVYELDEDGEELDPLNSFKTEEEATKFADSQAVPAHVVLTAEDEWEESEVEEITGYEPYTVIYKNEAAKDLEECLHKHCHKEFKFDDEPYKAPFRGAEVEVEDKELEYDDEPSMDY